MLTCFIKTDFTTTGQIITASFFLLVPFLLLIASIYYTCYMWCNKALRRNPKYARFFFNNIFYMILYLTFNTPNILLYLLSISSKIRQDTFRSYLSFVIIF